MFAPNPAPPINIQVEPPVSLASKPGDPHNSPLHSFQQQIAAVKLENAYIMPLNAWEKHIQSVLASKSARKKSGFGEDEFEQVSGQLTKVGKSISGIDTAINDREFRKRSLVEDRIVQLRTAYNKALTAKQSGKSLSVEDILLQTQKNTMETIETALQMSDMQTAMTKKTIFAQLYTKAAASFKEAMNKLTQG